MKKLKCFLLKNGKSYEKTATAFFIKFLLRWSEKELHELRSLHLLPSPPFLPLKLFIYNINGEPGSVLSGAVGSGLH